MSLQQPVRKANKYRSISMEQKSLHIEQLSRIGLLMDVLKPSIITKKHFKPQQKVIEMKHNHQMNKVSSAFMHCLHMDLTPYQTLKQLIIENKQLAKQSQSAYFLSKQAHKLINFIDGWAQLSSNPNLYNEDNFVFIDQKQQTKKISIHNKRRSSNDKNRSQTTYKQQERQQLKQRLKQQQKIRKQGQNQLKRIDQIITKKKVSQKLSTKPALILDQQTNPNTNQINYEVGQIQDQQLEIEVQQISISKCDQNNINTSNLNIRQQNYTNNKHNKNNKLLSKQNIKGQTNNNKVIKLYSNKNSQNKNQNLPNNHHKHNIEFQQDANLNQIIRPQYQKTEVSFSSNSSLTQSRQSQTVNKQVIVKKKTVIPLLKKGKQSSVSYNDVMKNKGNTIKQVEENKMSLLIVNKENRSSLQNKIEIEYNRVENEMIEKGFMSQDTDANSRLTVITKKGKITTNNEQIRSLSPKVEGRKKVVVKLSSNLNKKQSNNQNQQSNKEDKQQLSNQNNLLKVSIKNKSISSSQQQTNKLQRQLQQLQQQFMNMNIRKSLQKEQNHANRQNKQFKEDNHDYNNDQSNEGYLIPQQQNQLFIKPITSNENKTLQLIMKTQKHNNNNNNNNNNINSNRSKVLVANHQLNSIVMQQQPWECDQLQLQEQLKAIDEKIQDRKSILSKRQLNQTHNTNNSNTLFNQTTPNELFNHTINCVDRLFPNDHVNINMNNNNNKLNNNNNKSNDNNRHKRSNTTVNNNNTQQRQYLNHYQQQRVYTQHLFQDQNQQELNQIEQHPTNQPKVVRLSLTALTQNINKKSRDSIKHNHQHNQPNNIHKYHTSKSNTYKNPLPYSHQFNRNVSQTKLNKDTSLAKLNKDTSQSKLNKEPSCKSILLFEQASKRGISPSKSNRSLRSNNRDISPIKQYNQKDTNIVRTPRNMQNNPMKQRQNIKIYQSQSVSYLGNHSPSPLNRNNINITPLNRNNRSRTPFNQNNRSRTPPNKGRQQQISNFSPLQYNNNNEDKNKLIYLKNQQHYPQEFSSHSRTLSDMIDSEYSRAKKMGYGQNNQCFNTLQNENIVRQRYEQYSNVSNNQYLLRQNPNEKDYSMYSNCERYFYANEQNEQEQMNRNQVMMGNKWKAPINSNKNISPMNRNRTKVLLSDQLGG